MIDTAVGVIACSISRVVHGTTAQWASLGVEMDKTPGGNFLL